MIYHIHAIGRTDPVHFSDVLLAGPQKRLFLADAQLHHHHLSTEQYEISQTSSCSCASPVSRVSPLHCRRGLGTAPMNSGRDDRGLSEGQAVKSLGLPVLECD